MLGLLTKHLSCKQSRSAEVPKPTSTTEDTAIDYDYDDGDEHGDCDDKSERGHER